MSNPLLNVLANPFVVGLVLPLVLVIGLALPTKIIRGGGGWKRSDFFQGVELCWASLAAGLLNFYDLLRTEYTAPKIASNASFAIIAFFVLMFVISRHQDLEAGPSTGRQMVWLAFICNLLGVALFASLVIFVKGV